MKTHFVVRTLQVNTDAAVVKVLAEKLSNEERLKASRYRRAQDTNSYVFAHALLRSMLEQCPGWCPINGRIAPLFPDSKPVIQGCNCGDIDVTLTHTTELVACAIGFGCRIGIDTEKIGVARMEDIDNEIFSAAEHEWLCQRPAQSIPTNITQLWTLKEAVGKAIGTGIAEPRRLPPIPQPTALTCKPRKIAGIHRWSFHQWRPIDSHVVAVAASESVMQDS